MYETLKVLPFKRELVNDILKDRVTAVDITNVARYYYMENDREVWNLGEHFPQCKSPWGTAWLEWTVPPLSVSEKFGLVKNQLANVAFGALVARFKLDASEAGEVDFGRTAENGFEGLKKAVGWAKKVPNATDVMLFNLYTERWSQIAPSECLGIVCVAIDKQGDWVGDRRGACTILSENLDEEWRAFIDMIFRIPLLSFSFANCKNVELVDTVPKRKGRPQKAKVKKPAKTPTVVYKTLHIEAMRPRTRASNGDTRGKASLHICRGHFKDYREHGLFGQHHGVYWWESHIRGDETEGRVHKVYKA